MEEVAVTVPAGPVALRGDLARPRAAAGIVLFVHGSGSSRLSPRNRRVAAALGRHGLATLLMDLLTAEEEAEDLRTAALRFDIPLLTGRVERAVDWLRAEPATAGLGLGLFGASTGAAAALIAAARRPGDVAAVVSRGGRPDLAGAALEAVRAPTLLIVGGADATVLRLNRAALAALGGPARLEVVPGATHLFAEPGALEAVARLAAAWFVRHLPGAAGPAAPAT
ncbi:MAG: dienelactone hydrolase family protein [Thermoleophilia bacterium]|jgi:putative phosphoribosyl transferase|nr:dienelactone hydrolase family protein [Thermoleophilia bacterium]